MIASALVYALVGAACGAWVTYALTDPTAAPPSNRDAGAVLAATFAWPVWLVVLVVGVSLDAVWGRRYAAYYGQRP